MYLLLLFEVFWTKFFRVQATPYSALSFAGMQSVNDYISVDCTGAQRAFSRTMNRDSSFEKYSASLFRLSL